MSYNKKKLFGSVIYRTPIQNKNKFELFLSNLEMILGKINKSKPILSVVTVDFNARSSYWLCRDITTTEGLNCFH